MTTKELSQWRIILKRLVPREDNSGYLTEKGKLIPLWEINHKQLEQFIEQLLEAVIEEAFNRGYIEGAYTGTLQAKIGKPVYRKTDEDETMNGFKKLLGLKDEKERQTII